MLTSLIVMLYLLQAFVTCSSGVHMVGLVMLTISSLCASSSYVNGRLSRRVDRKLLIPLGYVVHISMLTFMLVYTPTLENRYVMFIIAGTWGVADGIFVTQVVSKSLRFVWPFKGT